MTRRGGGLWKRIIMICYTLSWNEIYGYALGIILYVHCTVWVTHENIAKIC